MPPPRWGLFSGARINSQGQDMLITVMLDVTEEVTLRKEVERQRQQLENVIEGTLLGTWEWDIATGELICNDRWFEMLGYDPKEVGRFTIERWRALCHGDDLAVGDGLMQRHFARETPYYSHEIRLRRKDGAWAWVLCRGQVIERDQDGVAIRMFGIHLDIAEKMAFEEKLSDAAIRDSLTNLYNRRHVFEHLDALIAKNVREKVDISLAMLDIDHFKAVNDEYGHLAGDFVLREFSRVIEGELRPYDLCGRYGGEEFIIIANDSRDKAAGIVQRILNRIRASSFVFEGTPIRFTFSAGVADIGKTPQGNRCGEALIAIADRRLYAAKEAGRNRVINEG